MIDRASLIKNIVTMPQVLSMYGLPLGRYNRIPCPIHSGKNGNLWYRDNYFCCFKCGAHGDVIGFVSQYFGLPFMDACRKLDEDFHLGLNVGGTLDAEKRAEAERVSAELRAKRDRKEAERKRLEEAYHTALDRWCELDKVKRNGKPRTPFDDLTEQYAYAVSHIDAAAATLDEAEINLWKFEHSEERTTQS